MQISRIRLSSIGGSGIKMLLISLLTITATGGLSLLLAQFHVWRVAKRTPTTVSRCRQLVVLGMQLQMGECSEDFRQRLRRALRLLESGTGESICILGGVTTKGESSEALAGYNYLISLGCDANKVLLEERSRHTIENLQQIRHLLGQEPDFTLISSSYHLARSAAMARGMGLKPQLCAAENSLQLTPHILFRLIIEGLFLHWYYSGRYWAKLVKDHKSLERIS